MEKVNVSAVSYLNTKPFLYGIERSPLKEKINLALDIPSVCAQKLIRGEADLGLVPVAAIPSIPGAQIISHFCIASQEKVGTVNLYSDVPVEGIETILLDYQSRTSVKLVQILAKNLWKIKAHFIPASEGFIEEISGTTAGLVIGDRTFSLKGRFRYEIDLASEWQRLTGLPFVFAAWVANKDLPVNFIEAFNEALANGVAHKHLAVELWQNSVPPGTDLLHYFEECISFELDDKKREAMDLFHHLAAALTPVPDL